MIWTIITAIATIISTIAYLVTVMYIRAELKGLEKDRYLAVTSEIYALWQSKDFMEAQLWLLHKLQETTWEDFVRLHRGDVGELAFHRVGSFYDRVGTLVRMKLIDEKEILSTVGGYAIAVWQKIGPLVQEARRIENSVLFDDFEALLPACYECYVPALGMQSTVRPFSTAQPVSKIGIEMLKKRLEHKEPLTVLDVRQPKQRETDPRTLPTARVIAPDDIAQRYVDLPPDREVVVYCA